MDNQKCIIFILIFVGNQLFGHGAPTISLKNNGKDIFIEFGSPSPNLLDGVSAITDEGTRVPVSIFAVNGKTSISVIDTKVLRRNRVTFTASHPDTGEAAYKNQDFIVTDQTAPIITVIQSVISIPLGSDEPDFKSNAAARDNRDGDISANIVPTLGDGSQKFDSSKPITYTVTYNVSDRMGNKAIAKTAEYIVFDNIPPVLNITASQINLNLGTAPPDLLENVAATDNIDGDISSKIVISILKDDTTLVNDIDTSAVGIYTVFYNVTDGSGNAAETKKRTYRVGKIVDPMDDKGDSDGMADQWETDKLGNLRWHADEDADRDGISNFIEFTFDTEPFIYDIKFTAGWNLISLTRIPKNNAVSSVFLTAARESVLGNGIWEWDTEFQNFSIAKTLEPFKGYWIWTNQNFSLPVNTELGPAFVTNQGDNSGTFPDSDNDGMDDTWEKLHFDDELRWLGSDDNDFDGKSNKEEFDASPQTDPNGYIISINQGWNLMSLPSEPKNNIVSMIFKESPSNELIYHGKIWEWDTDQKTYISITEITPTKGFWIYSNKTISISIETK